MDKLFKTAFTLIELLVVIAIIGILSGLIVVTMNGVTEKANMAKAQVFSNSLRNALMMNLVSEWKFDGVTTERAATNADAVDTWSGAGNGTIPASPAIPTVKVSSDCVNGSCLSFDGNDYVSTSLKPTSRGTIAAWFYLQSGSSSMIVGSQMATPDSRAYLGINSAFNLGGGIGTSTYNTIKTTETVPFQKWHYGALTWDGTNVRIYLNGKGYSFPQSGSVPDYALYIGVDNYSGGLGNYWAGRLDDVRFFDAAMPASQIKEQYYAGLNDLLANDSILNEEYLERVSSLAVAEK